jgi:hypothetical protein
VAVRITVPRPEPSVMPRSLVIAELPAGTLDKLRLCDNISERKRP